jgi:hypothetical protein
MLHLIHGPRFGRLRWRLGASAPQRASAGTVARREVTERSALLLATEACVGRFLRISLPDVPEASASVASAAKAGRIAFRISEQAPGQFKPPQFRRHCDSLFTAIGAMPPGPWAL